MALKIKHQWSIHCGPTQAESEKSGDWGHTNTADQNVSIVII